MRRDATHVLLVLVGGALVKITLDGSYLRYVKPTAEPWVLTAGCVLVGLACIAAVRDAVSGPPVEHHHVGAGWAWLLLFPVLAILLVAPPALGADSVLRADNRATAPTAAFPPLPRAGVVALPVSDFVTRSVWSHTLDHRTFSLLGFVVHQGHVDYVARLVITCCAADATPMRVRLTGHLADELPDDQWIRVTGRLRPGSATAADGYTPTLDTTALATVGAPADPYEH